MAKKRLFSTKKSTDTPEQAEQIVDELEIIAVIAAAVSALYSGTGITPRIKRVTRAPHPIWATAGLLKFISR